MLKVAINAVSLNRGGGLTGLLGYLSAWRSLETDLHITLFASRECVATAAEMAWPNIAIVPFAWGRHSAYHFLGQQLWLGRCIERMRPDVVMTTNTLVGRCSIPQLVHHRNLKRFLRPEERRAAGADHMQDCVKNYFSRRALEHAVVNVFISRFMQDRAEKVCPASRNRNHVVYNGLAAELIAKEYTRSRRDAAGCRIVAIQDTSYHKDNSTLITMMHHLVRSRPGVGWHLTVAGAGDWSPYVKLAEKIGVRDRIHFAGFLHSTQIDSLLCDATCLVFTSLLEGFGNPPIEAMARGCPVVASNSSAIPEIVGDAGMLVAPGQPSKFAEAVIGIYEDEGLRRALIMRGRERIREFNWLDSAQKMADLLFACAS